MSIAGGHSAASSGLPRRQSGWDLNSRFAERAGRERMEISDVPFSCPVIGNRTTVAGSQGSSLGAQAAQAYTAGSVAVLAAQLFMGPPGYVHYSPVTEGVCRAQLAADIANGDLSKEQASSLAAQFGVNPQKTQLTPTLIRYERNKNGVWHVVGVAPVLAPAPTAEWTKQRNQAIAQHLRAANAAPAAQPATGAQPAATPAAQATAQSSQRQAATGKRFVADSNLFMDRPVSAGNFNARSLFDDVLNDQNFKFVLPDLVRGEITPTATQTARLTAHAAQIENVSTDIKPLLKQHPNWTKGQLGVEDLQLLETALKTGLPIVTANSALKRQLAGGDPDRRNRYASVRILVPNEDFSSAAGLEKLIP